MDHELRPRPARRRPHWISLAAAAAMLVPAVYCQLYGQIYRNGESYYYGWPFLHPDTDWRFVSNAFWLDVAWALIIAAAAGFVAQRAVDALSNRGRFGISTLLLWMAILPPVLGVFAYFDRTRAHRVAADFLDDKVIFDPVAIQYPPWITLAACLGLTCLLYTILVAGIGVAKRCRRRGSNPDGE
jgi:ABC-type Fe3+ transport system permease subunit